MPAQIISGTEIAKQIREELKQEIAELKEKHNLIPGLATILVGEDPASQVYVGAKEKTSLALGIYSERLDLPADTSQEKLLSLIDKLNKDPKIHGILVQLPLPKHINETRVLYALIVAAGKPKAITADMVKEGVVVIDVGVNRVGKTPEGKAILVGDVDFDAVKEKAKAITPVPGGVGPMTIIMLMLNTVKAAKLAAGLA